MVQQMNGRRIYVEPNAEIPQDFGTLVYTRLKAPYWGVLFHTIDELKTPEFTETEDGKEEAVFILSPLWALRTAEETEDGSEYYHPTNLYVAYLDNDFYLTGIDAEGSLIIFNTVDLEDLTKPQSDVSDDEEVWEPLWEENDEEV